MSRSTSTRSSKSQSVLRRACRGAAAAAAFEPLETRRLMSAINWVNKGAGPGILDTDDFNAVFGANATIARTIVQRAIDDWERIIPNFNGFLGRNSYDVTINGDFLGGNVLADCAVTSFDGFLKPQAADIRIDNDAQGNGWYFDATPGTASLPDDSDFTSFVTPWAADRLVSTGRDLYRSVLHELGHAMGLASNAVLLTAREVPAGDDPLSSDPADVLKTIDLNGNGTPDYTLTTTGGRHLFEGGGGYAGPTHPNEVLNPGRAVDDDDRVRRGLVSDSIALLLEDVYSYTIALPSTINTFYVNFNDGFNNVTVTGDMDPTGDVDDNIDLEESGTAMRFEVNGTSETIEGAQFGAIIVNAGAGADDVDVDQLLSGKTVIVNGEDGNDLIQIAPEFGDIDSDLGSDVEADGGAGTDTITFNDVNDGSGSDTYTITVPSVQKGGRLVEHLLFETVRVTGSPQDSVYDVVSTSPFYELEVDAGSANDTFNVGDDDYDSRIFGDVDINGGAGSDTLNIEDDNDAGNGDYTLTHNSFSKTAGGDLTFSSVGTLVLNASGQGSLINVDLGVGGIAATVNAGAGDDTLDLGGASNDLDGALASSLTFNGQGGTDKLDLNDAGDSPDSDSYTLSGTSFHKPAVLGVLTFNGTEQIDLRGNDGANTITVEYGNLLSTQSVTVGGGGGDDVITSVVPGTISLLATDVTLQGGAGTDAIVLDDSGGGAADTYTLTLDTLQMSGPGGASGLITYTAEGFGLRTSMGASTIKVQSTLAGTDYSIDAFFGDDTIDVGTGGNTDAIDGPVTLTGGLGNDALNYRDGTNPAGHAYTVTASTIDRDGAARVTYLVMESLLVETSTGDDTIDLKSTWPATPATVNGNAGNDALVVGGGNWDANLTANVTFNGNGGASDSVRIDDTADVGADGYAVNAAQTTKNSTAVTVNYGTVENYTLDANAGANTVLVNATVAGATRVNGNAGADLIDLIDHAPGATVTLDGGAALDQVRVNGDAVGTASAVFDNTQDLASLTLGAGGSAAVEAGSASTLYTQGLTMPTGTTLDLADNDMIMDYTGASPINSIIAILIGAYNGGAWNGPGINSSVAAADPAVRTAIGYGESANLFTTFPTTFNGFAVDNTAILLRHTFYGDADLSGTVNLQDFNRLAANFGGSARRWGQGDFDFEGNVNLQDFNKLAANFGQSLAPGGAGGGSGNSEPLPSIEDLIRGGTTGTRGRGATNEA